MAMNDFEILYTRSPIAGPRPVMKKFVSGDQIFGPPDKIIKGTSHSLTGDKY